MIAPHHLYKIYEMAICGECNQTAFSEFESDCPMCGGMMLSDKFIEEPRP